jgi:hypothetical protein
VKKRTAADAALSRIDRRSIAAELIERRIFMIRGEKVILVSDLAAAYGVTIKALNQAIRRNAERFSPDFMFFLIKNEMQEVVTNCDHLRNRNCSPVNS